MPKEPLRFAAEEIEFFRAADEYRVLTEQPGWKRLLGELSKDADVALGRLRECRSSNPVVQANLAAEWRRHELFLKELHIKVYGAIESRDAFVRELAEATRKSEQEIEGYWMQEAMNG